MQEGKAEDTIRLGLAGDVMLGRLVNERLKALPYEYVWGNMLPLMKEMDINVINLETTFTKSIRKVPKTFNFKAEPDRVKCLAVANVTIASIANNHILDYSEEGMMETIATLTGEGIQHAGAGYNLQEAAKAARHICKGIRIGVLGFTDNEPLWKAGARTPGTNYIDIDSSKEREAALSAIQELKGEVDCCIVSIHWGPNMRERPPRQFISFAHAMAEHGADIIHGHSAHIFQGIEVYHNKLILYDTGDFVDDYQVDPFLRNDRTFFFICAIAKSGVQSVSLIPALIDNFQVNRATGEDYEWCVQRMKRLSKELGTEVGDDCEIIIEQKNFQQIGS